SDEPHPNAEIVELKDKTLNQVALPAAQLSTDDSQLFEQIRYSVTITSPEEEATIRDNNGEFEVIATVTPELKGQYLMALKLDGKPIGPPQVGGVFKLTKIDRGEHLISVDAMMQNGKVFASSAPRKIFLHQAVLKPTPKKQPKSN
ncbi:MAG: DUF4124 domain-containing protein, partial [Shewanella sp.]